MKTSNKWLLGFILVTVGFALTAYKILYNEYEKGHFVTTKQIHDEQFISQPIHAPRVIVLDGAIWINLIPADQFSLELPRINKDADDGLFREQAAVRLKMANGTDAAVTWHQNGDTLFVNGHIDRPLHRPWSNYYYRVGLPQVNLLGPPVNDILVNNSQVYLQGSASAGDKRSARLTVRNSTLWLGMQYENGSHPSEYFDTVDIQSNNSITIINTPADIGHINMTLTDSSQVHETFATLGSSSIRYSSDSRVNLTGGNLKKTQLIIR